MAASTRTGGAARGQTTRLAVAVPPGLDLDAVQRAVDATVRELSMTADIRSMLGGADTIPAPQLLAAAAQQERRWRRIEARYGLLGSGQVARLAGSRSHNAAEYASQLRAKGQILAVLRRGRYVYPGFQFTERGHIRPAVPRILAVLGAAGWDAESITLWMTSPNGYLAATPADRLDDTDAVLDAATNAAHTGH